VPSDKSSGVRLAHRPTAVGLCMGKTRSRLSTLKAGLDLQRHNGHTHTSVRISNVIQTRARKWVSGPLQLESSTHAKRVHASRRRENRRAGMHRVGRVNVAVVTEERLGGEFDGRDNVLPRRIPRNLIGAAEALDTATHRLVISGMNLNLPTARGRVAYTSREGWVLFAVLGWRTGLSLSPHQSPRKSRWEGGQPSSIPIIIASLRLQCVPDDLASFIYAEDIWASIPCSSDWARIALSEAQYLNAPPDLRVSAHLSARRILFWAPRADKSRRNLCAHRLAVQSRDEANYICIDGIGAQ